MVNKPSVCIIGAGFSGICAAVKLKQRTGQLDFVILESNGEVGGTWLVNTYPGCACDILSHLYSFSFELNPDWPQAYSAQPEILKYLIGVVDKYDIRRYIQFNTVVVSQVWDEKLSQWKLKQLNKTTGVETEVLFDIIIDAVGPLRIPNIPDKFLNTPFKGTIMHSAEWDKSVELANKRVAVIGTGASAIQIVPVIADQVASLTVFQRKPGWTLSRGQFTFSTLMKGIFRTFPFLMSIYRRYIFLSQELFHSAFHQGSIINKLGPVEHLFKLWRFIPNKQLRDLLTPKYSYGCKRVLLTDTFIEAFAKPNVHLIGDKINCLSSDCVVTSDGTVTPVDIVVLATGFKAQDFFAPLHIVGKSELNLHKSWLSSYPSTYLGITVSGIPNCFVVLGPNTGLGHNSIIVMIESQVDYIMQVIDEFIRRDAKTVEVKLEAQEQFVATVKRDMKGTVWGSTDCGSWYANGAGEVTALWPKNCMTYMESTKTVDFDKYVFK